MTRRTNRLSAELSKLAQQYKRKAQRKTEPNDRQYSREAEAEMKRLAPEQLSELLSGESDELIPLVKQKTPANTPLAGPKRKRP